MQNVSSPQSSDESIEQEISRKGKTAARITPADIEAAIDCELTFTAGTAADRLGVPHHPALDQLTICVLTLKNGFTVIGESACASPENFDAEIGRRIARENAKQKLWPLLGYALRNHLTGPYLPTSTPAERGELLI